jgi:cytidylate kinase
MPRSVVCISVTDGAGAKDAASQVADALGYQVIDEAIVAQVAAEAGVDLEVVADVERRRGLIAKVLDAIGSAGAAGAYAVPGAGVAVADEPPSEALIGMIRSVIEDTAAIGSVVIVSHAASLALGGRDDVLRVLITGSPLARAQRIREIRDCDEQAAEQVVKKGDAGRADYIKRFYGIRDELPTHYDLVINTDNVSSGQAAQLIVAAVG